MLIILNGTFIFGQNKIYLGLTTYESIDNKASKATKWTKIDSITIYTYINNALSDFQSKGYILTNLDTVIFHHDTCWAHVYLGKKYKIGGIFIDQDIAPILESSGVKSARLKGAVVDSVVLSSYLKTLVRHQANNGHPFAKARFDSIRFDNEKLFGNLKIQKGNLVTYDEVLMEGRLVMQKSFLYHFLDIKPNGYYNHDRVTNMSSRLKNLPYVQVKEEPYIRFVNDQAKVVLNLDPKPSSRFDFLIGILPSINPDGSRKWNITGDFTAELNNSFSIGEYIYFQFKRLKPENLELQIKNTIPYIFGLPIGSHFDFRIFKNGLQNIDLFFNGGFQYQFGGFNNIKIYGSYRSSKLLEINESLLTSQGKLPTALDVGYSGVGLGLDLRQVDYRFNPTRGYTAEANVVVGNKNITPNRVIVQLEGFENSYDTIKQNTFQADVNVSLAKYVPVQDWATVKFAADIGLRYNQQKILNNELLRIGGNKLLRGFDEESILTDFYAFSTVEFRFVFDQNSYLSLPFIDYGFTRVQSDGKTIYDPVLGIGMGLNFGTPAGIFNLSFAAGKNLGNPIDFGKMKVHFGYVNLF